jgi:fatty-acid desaturase
MSGAWAVPFVTIALTQMAVIATSIYLMREARNLETLGRFAPDALAPLINALGHWSGGRNFDDTASNRRLLAWVTGGESLHNNHHAHPRSAKFSVLRSELDPSWPIIRSLAAAGLLVIVGPPVVGSRVTTQRITS